ncbi:MAG: acetyl-CoA carboxylase biotin carboxyl carrier protein [Firmicutes bacterium]|nr:acetyl-CoA carboxylase biotin carboxyl carrier protein [Bacillota bacterium]
MFKIGEIRELIRLLDETSVQELKIETDTMKVFMKKADQVAPALESTERSLQSSPVQTSSHLLPVAATSISGSSSAETQERSAVEQAAVVPEGHLITSPMVGTFYRSPSPEAPAYVEVGSKVDAKTVVCIVEAMKLMNEIEAEVKGEILEIMVENGQLVEYGQPLFRVRLS